MNPNRLPGCVLEVVCIVRCPGAKKVSFGFKIFLKIDLVAQISVKQILTPPFVAMPDQAHELSGGVQSEWTRSAGQLQPGLFRGAVTLTVVAAVAARH